MKRRHRSRPYVIGLAVEIISMVQTDDDCPRCASGVIEYTYCTTRGLQVLAVRTVRVCNDLPLCTWQSEIGVSA